ncbi:hypothetical protein I7X12_16530 [Halosimplex litoreum]|uniref:Uncharacterized protein n=1 Tax=Halosimplex litoreum TaxID=1198301 RepID=A0A7T3FX50_9EURY|nr:hypothetical protein [Halosimplex litoreum]QPV62328.1 hypothetical protein I7X12_16530 [Halosimplex litoreum]
MSRRRRALLAVGLAAVVAGVVLTFRPGLVAFDWATLATLGIWVVALAGVAAAAFERFESDDAPLGGLPRVGERPDYGVPGDDLAAAVADAGAGQRDAADRDRVRERLRLAVVDALERFAGDTPEEAERRVAEGSWTDDPDAAALFADGDDSRHEGVEPDFDRRAERAAAAVARLRDRTDRGEAIGTDRSDRVGDSRRSGGVADD